MSKVSYILCFVHLIVICHGTLPMFPERLMELPQFKGKYTGKIVGGEPVDQCSQYPHQVSIQRKSIMAGGYSHFCGGSIIDAKHVATAGHCVSGRSPSGLSVIVGTHKLDAAGREGIRRNVESVTVHHSYSAKDVDYDIAVIRLDRALDLASDCITPVQLPKQDEDFVPGTSVYATGWGTTSEGGSTSSTLRVVDVPVVSQAACKDSYGEDDISENMICAGIKEGGKDSCQGDSGGPLVNKNNVLVGITSWGYGCARPDYYGVYTRVSKFVAWVEATMAKKS